MIKLSGIILKILGWKIMGEFPNLEKSVIIFAPHTSNWDLVVGKIYMNEIGIKNRVLVKKELFFFPMNLIMNAIGAIPVDRNDKKNNIIYQATSFFKKNTKFNLVISAEGTRKKVNHWKRGFFHIAQKADVPIVISYLDYKKKEVGIKEVIRDTSDIKETMKVINKMYKNFNPKYPENFTLDKRFS